MEQLALVLPPPRARRKDPATSHAAARRAQALQASHHELITAALATPGTIYEIGERCSLDHVKVARRMPELKELGLAQPTEEKRQGCRVWRRATAE